MTERTFVSCPWWCELGKHTGLDPCQASIGDIDAAGFEVELLVRQYDRAQHPEVALTLDVAARDGGVAARHTLVHLLRGDVDVAELLPDHRQTFVPYGGVRDGRGRPVVCDPPRRVGGWRVTRARQALTGLKTALADESRPYDAAGWVGRLMVALENALAHIEEQEDTRP